jgi:hypothetical protein
MKLLLSCCCTARLGGRIFVGGWRAVRAFPIVLVFIIEQHSFFKGSIADMPLTSRKMEITISSN